MPEKIPSPERRQAPEIPPELVKKIEQLKINPDHKVNLLLTKAGLKPASELELLISTKDSEGKTVERMTDEDIEQALAAIEELGLPRLVKEREVDKRPFWSEEEPDIEKFFKEEKIDVLIGRSQKELDLLVEALKSGDEELIGRAFGYPPTAVEAFVGKRESIELKTLSEEAQEASYFLTPTFSEDNWQEELKIAQRNADFIKKINPTIHAERLKT